MYIREYGNRNDPTVILLAPMMVSGSDLYHLMSPHFQGHYHFIAPDQGGHGQAGPYISAEMEYRDLKGFLQETNCTEIALVYGASLGVAVGWRLYLDPDFRISHAWFDGVALCKNAGFAEWFMKRLFKHRKKTRNRKSTEASESLVSMYGYNFAKMMTANFARITSEDIDAMEYAQNHPEDRRAAKQAIEEIRALQPVSAFELDTAEAEAIFRGIMQEFRASAKEYVEKAAELTSTVMKRVLAKAHSLMKSPEKFRGFTPEMMVDSIIGSVPQLDLENEHVKVLHDALLPLFTRPQDLIKQKNENTADSQIPERKK